MAPSDLRGFEGSNLKNTMLQVLQRRTTQVKDRPCLAQAPWVCPSLGSAPSLPQSPFLCASLCQNPAGLTFALQLEPGKEPSRAQRSPPRVPAGLGLTEPCTASGPSQFWHRKARAALTNQGPCGFWQNWWSWWKHSCWEVPGGDKSEPEELQVCPLIANAKMKHLALR